MLRPSRILFAAVGMARSKPVHPLVAIIGATGTGKSQLAVDLALKFDGEIINADAMQLYDGLPIITNKITLHECKGVPHHLLGCVSLDDQPWRADTFVKNALDTIAEIRARGRIPIVVGGTHYYTQSLLFQDTLVETRDTIHSDTVINTDTEVETTKWPILQESADIMYAKLKEVDPIMAARWHPNDGRKIRRSLEIWLQTGKRASELYEEQEKRRMQASNHNDGHSVEEDDKQGDDLEQASTGLRFPSLIFWVHVPRELGDRRLDMRVDQMVQAGLLREARQLEDYAHERVSARKEVDRTRGIYAAVGYKEFRALLDAFQDGVTDTATLQKLEQDGIEMTKIATRRYAKTQIRWIRTKLLNALRNAKADKSMLLLDASAPDNWVETVLVPAVKRMEAFLHGDEPGQSEDDESSELMSPLRNYDMSRRRDLWQQRTCDICKVTTVDEEGWRRHIDGSRHRRNVRSRQKKQRPPKLGPPLTDDVPE